ncbi:MAG: hypothetical protein MUE61_22085, partial [Vicinamibacterales bacterium]|nr:hypothetical protein [Vicinamibacterales bacterium]
KHQNRRVALERPGQDLGALDAEVRPAVLDRGNRGLGDTGQLRQLALAEFLELAKNADGLWRWLSSWSSRRMRTDSPTETSTRGLAG